MVLTEEGYDALLVALPELPAARVTTFSVQDTDEMGMWVLVARPDGDHMLLIRWEFVLTVDIANGERQVKAPGFGSRGEA